MNDSSLPDAARPSVPGGLVARLEASTGPDRQIEREIAKALDPAIWKRATNRASMPCGAPQATIERDAIRWVPAYTEGLDAALALAERLGLSPVGVMKAAMYWAYQAGAADNASTLARFACIAILRDAALMASVEADDTPVSQAQSGDEGAGQ